MINIKSSREIDLMRTAGKIVAETFNFLEKQIKPGVTTKKINSLAENFIIKSGATPSFKNYDGFPAAICTSVNDVVVHGIPSNYKLQDGDILSLDIGANYKGYHGDGAFTFAVGNIDKDKEMLLKETMKSLEIGLSKIKSGVRLGVVSNAIGEHAKKHKLGIVKELVGHGIGNKLHEEPDIPNYGSVKEGIILKEGMTLAIEPMLNLGTQKVYMEDDDWTIKTKDGKSSAHFEHTVLVTRDGYEILTKR